MSKAQQDLTTMASKPCTASKKWRMTVIAVQLLMIIFVLALAAIWFVPPAAESIVSLAKIALAALGLLTSAYCGVQAHADGKTALLLQA